MSTNLSCFRWQCPLVPLVGLWEDKGARSSLPHATLLLVRRFYNTINLLLYLHVYLLDKINLLLYRLDDLHNVTGEWALHYSNLERQLPHCQATAMIGAKPIGGGGLKLGGGAIAPFPILATVLHRKRLLIRHPAG